MKKDSVPVAGLSLFRLRAVSDYRAAYSVAASKQGQDL